MRVAIVAANTLAFDSRLRRAATALADAGHRVTLVGLAGDGLPARESLPGRPDVELVRVALDRRISGAFRPLPAGLRSVLARLAGIDPEATVLPPSTGGLGARVRRLVEIVAVVRRTGSWARLVAQAVPDAAVVQGQSLVALPVVRGAARRLGAQFVYDIADIHTEAARLARMPGWFRRLVRGREAGWLRDAAGLTAASPAMAREAARQFGVARPVVVLNCPPAWRPKEPIPAVEDRLRPAAGLPPDRAVILYQGGFSIDRGLEALVAALDEPALRERDLAAVFLGYGRLRDWLLAEAARRPGRMVVLDAVPPDDLPAWTAAADVAYVGVPPSTLNHRVTLANKLFESMMAGVPVLVGEETEQCRLVRAEGVGACADVERPAAVSAAIAALLDAPRPERDRLRRHARAVALERYSWEAQRGGLVALYAGLAGGAGATGGVGRRGNASPPPGPGGAR